MPDLTEDPLANYDPGDATALRSAAGVETSQEPPARPAPASSHDVPPQDADYDAPPVDDVPPPDYDQGPPPEDIHYDVPPEFTLDDVPPDDGYGHDVPNRSRKGDAFFKKAPPGTEAEREEMADLVLSTLRDCIATLNRSAGQEILDLLNYMLGSDNTLAYLDKDTVRVWKRVGEVLRSCAADDPDRQFDLFDIPDLDAASSKVVAEVEAIRARCGAQGLPTNPSSQWRALVERVQRLVAKDGARRMLAGIEEDLPDEDLMEIFASLQPPTTRKSLVNAAFARTAADWESSDNAADAERPLYRVSSGYPTFDWAVTAKDGSGGLAEPLGAFAPGEFWTIAAGSGMGKSSAARKLITAMAEDIVTGWGHEHSKVYIGITEEAPKIVYQAAGLAAGEPFHHLAGNVVIADVGASRARFIKGIWDCVIDAYHRSKETGLPIVDCGLPEVCVLDYITGIQGQGEGETNASEITANLLLRGVAGWKVTEMEQFSGENFAAYAGMSWPEGMENFKPAVIAFAQFRKLEGQQAYEPGKTNLDDFVVEDANGQPMWEVLPGDFRIPKIAEIRGSGVIVQHSTGVVVLHRSRPTAATFKDPVTGKSRLTDDRARWIFLKTRNSAALKAVPMRFDSNFSGLRGQFYDLLAERAVEAKALNTLPSYTRPGDAMLPPRPASSPFDGVVY